jgi:putative ABC transport system permease protein
LACVLGEAAAVGLLGSLLGLLISYPIVQQGLGRWLEERMGSFFPYFRIPPEVAALAVLFSVVLAAIAAALPAYRASKLDVVEALRRLG